jgi:hypothetical protein
VVPQPPNIILKLRNPTTLSLSLSLSEVVIIHNPQEAVCSLLLNLNKPEGTIWDRVSRKEEAILKVKVYHCIPTQIRFVNLRTITPTLVDTSQITNTVNPNMLLINLEVLQPLRPLVDTMIYKPILQPLLLLANITTLPNQEPSLVHRVLVSHLNPYNQFNLSNKHKFNPRHKGKTI